MRPYTTGTFGGTSEIIIKSRSQRSVSHNSPRTPRLRRISSVSSVSSSGGDSEWSSCPDLVPLRNMPPLLPQKELFISIKSTITNDNEELSHLLPVQKGMLSSAYADPELKKYLHGILSILRKRGGICRVRNNDDSETVILPEVLGLYLKKSAGELVKFYDYTYQTQGFLFLIDYINPKRLFNPNPSVPTVEKEEICIFNPLALGKEDVSVVPSPYQVNISDDKLLTLHSSGHVVLSSQKKKTVETVTLFTLADLLITNPRLLEYK